MARCLRKSRLNHSSFRGFDRDNTPSVLGVPEDFQVEILIAIGKQRESAALPEDIQAREQPTPRKPLAGFYAEGQFNFKE